MADLKIEVTYFEKPGLANTDKALEIAKKYADQFNVRDIIVASTSGNVAEKAAGIFNPNEYNLVVIAHSYYFVGTKKRQEFDDAKLSSLKEKGVKIHFATHSMAGIERNIRIEYKQWCFVDLMAKFMREQFSQGTKVCIEIASMAVDAGLIDDLEKDVICVGGTGHGSDTVCLIKPAPTSLFNKLRVKAILSKPL